jgi:hypothetical protein
MSNPFTDPSTLDWFPFQHSCGCVLDWGVPAGKRRVFDQFFPNVAPHSCPVHSLEKGHSAIPLKPNELRMLVPGILWYRLADAEKHAYGKDNRNRALRGSTVEGRRFRRPERAAAKQDQKPSEKRGTSSALSAQRQPAKQRAERRR